jgi:hypothetical protein
MIAVNLRVISRSLSTNTAHGMENGLSRTIKVMHGLSVLLQCWSICYILRAVILTILQIYVIFSYAQLD